MSDCELDGHQKGDDGQNRAAEDVNNPGPKLSQIAIPLETWTKILGWIDRKEMARSLSLVCSGLKELCWPRLHGDGVKAHYVVDMHLIRDWEEDGHHAARPFMQPFFSKERFSIPSIPPPNYILGFLAIVLNYFDEEIFHFLRIIKPRLPTTSLHFCNEIEESPQELATLRRLIAFFLDTTRYLCIDKKFADFYPLFPDIVEHSRLVCVFLDSSGEQPPIASILRLLAKRREDGQPRMLMIDYPTPEFRHALIDAIKEDFQSAIHPKSFFVEMMWDDDHPGDAFELPPNPITGETLAFYHLDVEDPYAVHYGLCRYEGGPDWRTNVYSEMHAIYRERTEIHVDIKNKYFHG